MSPGPLLAGQDPSSALRFAFQTLGENFLRFHLLLANESGSASPRAATPLRSCPATGGYRDVRAAAPGSGLGTQGGLCSPTAWCYCKTQALANLSATKPEPKPTHSCLDFFCCAREIPWKARLQPRTPAGAARVLRRGFPPLHRAAELIPWGINRPLKLHSSPLLSLSNTPALSGPAGLPARRACGSNLTSRVYYSGGKNTSAVR